MAEIRRYRRFVDWDYQGKGASLFITIVTEPRRACFGEIVDSRVVLSKLGEIVAEALMVMAALNPGVRVFGFVVMPDHVHFNVHLAAGLDEPLKVLGKAISRFKNYTTKQAKILGVLSTPVGTVREGGPRASGDGRAARGLLWQQGYHDRLCLTRAFIDAAERYIAYNPLKWALMYQSPGALAVYEPLDSARLSAGDYWKGVGNLALLAPENKIVSLRVSRRLSQRQNEAALQRMMRAVDAGFTVLSGFISPGEKMIRDSLCSRKDSRFIRILPSCLPNCRFKPESRYVSAFADHRYLEIAKGNDETELTRGVCLAYNDEIVEVAKAGEGRAVYFTPEGMQGL